MTKTEIQNKASNLKDVKELLSNKKVTGYVWMIESKEPRVYYNEVINFDNLNTTKNPYNKIQEAYLTDGKHSIHIKNIDGKEKVFVFAYQDFKGDNYLVEEAKAYPSHVNDIENLHFKQVYQLTNNEISEGFQTWQPVVKLFTGLTLKNN